MPAQRLDFIADQCDGVPCEQGANFLYEMVWSVEQNGVEAPVNLTGYSAKMQVKAKLSSDPVIVELSTANSRIVLGTTGGEITLKIPAAVTAPLVPGNYKYDLELTDGTGFVTRLIEGTFQVVGEITV